MPQFPKPFFRPARGVWYVQVAGRQINLGPDQEAAFTRYHELMSQPAAIAPPVGTFVVIGDAFLDWCQQHRAPRTYDWYKERIQSFVKSVQANLTVAQLRPFHVQQWADSHGSWNDGMKRGCMLAIQRALNWAVKMGHIDRSPIAHMEKPKAGKREQIVTPEQYNKLLELIHDQRFRDVITLAWESGARPQEIVHVEGRHVDLQNSRLVIPAEEAKGKKRIRVVYLTEPAMAIVQRLVLKYPKGKLFRNEDGLPWNRYSVSCRFARLGKKIGVKVCLYTFRHSFCHRALKNGVDPITLANLMGHVDPTMIARVYSHLSQDQKYLKESLKRATA